MDPLDDELAERGRALIAAAVAETMAPLALRERIEADRARAGQRGGARRSRGLLGKLVPAGGLVAAAVVALVLVLGGSSAPSVLATASLATRGPVLPGAGRGRGARHPPQDLDARASPFPYWGGSFKWEAVGARDDKIEDRSRQDRVLRQPQGRPRGLHDPRRRHDRRALGRAEKDKNGVKLFITTG